MTEENPILAKNDSDSTEVEKTENVESLGDLENGENQQTMLQFCVFKTGDEEYALPIELIKEVVKFDAPAPLPQTPDYILGMVNIRGNIFGVMDIERFFSIESTTEHNYLLVLDHETFKMSIGIPKVPDSLLIEEDEIEEIKSSTLKSHVGQQYMKGIIKKDGRMIIVFDIMGIIASENFTVPA